MVSLNKLYPPPENNRQATNALFSSGSGSVSVDKRPQKARRPHTGSILSRARL